MYTVSINNRVGLKAVIQREFLDEPNLDHPLLFCFGIAHPNIILFKNGLKKRSFLKIQNGCHGSTLFRKYTDPDQQSNFVSASSIIDAPTIWLSNHLLQPHIVWKWLKMSHLNFSILAFFTNFWLIKTDLSGSSVWPQALGFQKLAKFDHFWHF